MYVLFATESGATVAGAPVPGISHESLLLFLLQFGVLLLLARGLGIAANRMGMPSVVGELLAGLILGPTIFGALLPDVRNWLFPAEAAQVHLLDIVAFIGVVLLLILTGLETDLKLIASKGKQALRISVMGIVIPLALGVVLGLNLGTEWLGTNPETGEPVPQLTFALFMGIAMAISAIPVIAKVFIDLKAIKRDLGQLTLAAAMVDDTMAWILLGIVSGIARSGSLQAGTVVRSFLTVIGFMVVSYTVGRWIVNRSLRAVGNVLPGDGPMISSIMVFALAFAAFAQFLGVEAVLGAFVLGIIAGQIRRVHHGIVHTLETICISVFAPVFFAQAGLKVDLRSLVQPRNLVIGLLVLGIAILGKFAGAYLGAKWAGLGKWEALSLGAGMNARGAVEIIIATIGLNLGVLGRDMFTIIVMVAIVTSLMAPPILRITLPKVPYTDEERERLAREAAVKTSLLGNVHRVLLPTRGGTNSQVAAQLVKRMADGAGFEVTVMQVSAGDRAAARTPVAVGAGGGGGTSDVEDRFERIEGHLGLGKDRVKRLERDAEGRSLAEVVIAETQRGGYDMVVLGATETLSRDGDAALFSGWVDEVLQGSPVPVLVVSSRWEADASGAIDTLPMRRILLPTTGSEVNRAASEVAFEIANDDDALVDVIHVVEPPREGWGDTGAGTGEGDRARMLAEDILAAEAKLGLSAGAIVHTEPVISDAPLDQVILDRARSKGADLIVLRSDVKPTTQRAFLGHEVDRVLRDAPCPVAVITRG